MEHICTYILTMNVCICIYTWAPVVVFCMEVSAACTCRRVMRVRVFFLAKSCHRDIKRYVQKIHVSDVSHKEYVYHAVCTAQDKIGLNNDTYKC